MRKQLFGVAGQAFYSVITLLALRVWTFNKDLSLGFLLHIPVLIFQGRLLKQPFQVEPVKVCDLCPNHLVSNRCLLPCSLISCSLYFLKKYIFFLFFHYSSHTIFSCWLLTWDGGFPFPQFIVLHPPISGICK